MDTRKPQGQPIASLKNGLLNLLQDKLYGKDTVNNYRRKLNQLEQFMISNRIIGYESSVGQIFFDVYLSKHSLGKSGQQFLRTVIRRLDDFASGIYRLQRKTDRVPLSQSYSALLGTYLRCCRGDGNKESTISGKESFLREFCTHLETLGYVDLRHADAATIGRACLMQHNKDGWAVIRMFLRYLNRAALVSRDFSMIIPRFTKAFRLPSTYTEDEIKRFEGAIDGSTKTGKRDYAMLLLATRLGMRSGDIANLTFSAIDFENDTVSISQEKTGEPLTLPMVAAAKNALVDYLNNGRPESTLPYVFLRVNAPFEKITTSVIRFVTTKYFIEANINISQKKHGPHVFRSSLASSMVNQMVSYDVVRKILGLADISLPGRRKHERGPCLHCLRHVFVFDSFSAAVNAGRTVDDSVPYLSIYLGHDSLRETEKYMKFSSELFPMAMGLFSEYSAEVFPEVSYET